MCIISQIIFDREAEEDEPEEEKVAAVVVEADHEVQDDAVHQGVQGHLRYTTAVQQRCLLAPWKTAASDTTAKGPCAQGELGSRCMPFLFTAGALAAPRG